MARKGLLGCLVGGCVVVPILLVALVAGSVWLNVNREEQPESLTAEHAIPGSEIPVASPAEAGEAAGADAPPALAPELPLDIAEGTLHLDVGVARLEVFPGSPGEPLRAEVSYDAASHEFEERFDEGVDGAWEYRVKLRPRFGRIGLLGVHRGPGPELRIYVPPGVAFSLVGDMGIGESDIELGGLGVTEIDLDLGAGEHSLSFASPTSRSLRRVRLDGGIGELRLEGLGHASPADVQVDQGLGELSVDLDGDWRGDGTVRLELGIGESRVLLPRTARVTVEGGSIGIGERDVNAPWDQDHLPEDAPHVRLRVSGGIGHISVR